MVIVGYLASVLIGISLGLIGGGGSILTVPVLVYLFGIDALLATVYSLFIVGVTSAVGSISYFKKGLVDVKIAIVFGIPSIVAIFLTRGYLLPAIPQDVLTVAGFTITKNILLMLLFAMLMIAASYSMIRIKNTPASEGSSKILSVNYLQMGFQGIFTGTITALIGAGGGFLIIPALVKLLKLPMKTAVGTSLVIISINSLTGFLISLPQIPLEWGLLVNITLIAVTGILIGSYFSDKIKANTLKPMFGWFVLVMGIYIFIKETILH